VLPHLIEAHHIEVAMAYVSLCSGHVLRRAKKQLLVAWTEADIASKFLILRRSLPACTSFSSASSKGMLGFFSGVIAVQESEYLAPVAQTLIRWE